jgi:capsule polysaccharide export protein KpsE/RkpR
LAPVSSTSSISGALKNFSGVAGIAGISIPGDGEDSSAAQAAAKLNTLSFFENNILPSIYLPDLMAFYSWKGDTNTVVYDESIFDFNTNSWVRDYSYPLKQKPSAQEAFEVFRRKHFHVSKDKNTGFITLSVKHQSPFIAKEWTETIVKEINSFYRQRDKTESETAASYLDQQITNTTKAEVRQVIANLLQEETQKLALIEASEFYVFNYIDNPAAMEQKSEPQRPFIWFCSLVIGMMLGIIMVLIRHFIYEKEDN